MHQSPLMLRNWIVLLSATAGDINIIIVNTDTPTVPTLSCNSSTLSSYQSAGQSDIESFSDKENNIDQLTSTESASKDPTIHCWETLNPALQAFLPNEKSTT